MNRRLDLTTRWIHLGLAAFGIAAYLSAEGAESGSASTGYLIHAWLGFAVAAQLGLRLVWAVVGPEPVRLSSWWSPGQWSMVREDLRGMARLRLPERPLHQGLAGWVQLFGILLFAYMALTGVMLYFLAEGHGLEWVEEAHEVGEALIPMFLFLHVGAVVAHSLAGHPVWQNAFAFWHSRRT